MIDNRRNELPGLSPADPKLIRQLRDSLRYRLSRKGRWRTVGGGRVLTLRTPRFEANLFSPFNSLAGFLTPPFDYASAALRQHLHQFPWQIVVCDEGEEPIFSCRWSHIDVIELIEFQPSAKKLLSRPARTPTAPLRLPLLAVLDGGISRITQARR